MGMEMLKEKIQVVGITNSAVFQIQMIEIKPN